MAVLIAYLIPILLIFLGFKYKSHPLITMLLALYYWILMGLNTYTPDYENYETRYDMAIFALFGENDGSEIHNTEWGYASLNLIFYLLGFSYQQFRMIYCAFYSLLAISTAKRLCNHPNLILSLFLFYPLLPFVSSQRQTMACMIVCWAVPFLLNNNIKGIAKYIISVLFAATIHNSVLFYLIFIFAPKPFSKMRLRFLYMSIFLLTLFMFQSAFFFSSYLNPRYVKYLDKSSDMTNHLNFNGFLLTVFMLVGVVFLITKQSKYLIRNNNKLNQKGGKPLSVSQIVLYKNVFILMLASIPVYTVSAALQRLLLGILPVGYALYGGFAYNRNVKVGIRKNISMLFFAVIILLMWYYINSSGDHDIFATLYDNMLFR